MHRKSRAMICCSAVQKRFLALFSKAESPAQDFHCVSADPDIGDLLAIAQRQFEVLFPRCDRGRDRHANRREEREPREGIELDLRRRAGDGGIEAYDHETAWP